MILAYFCDLFDLEPLGKIKKICEDLDKRVVIFLTRVYDITGYDHPGGNWMLKTTNCNINQKNSFLKILGQEVSRYLNGTSEVEQLASGRWSHSSVAYSLLEKEYFYKDLFSTSEPEKWNLRRYEAGKELIPALSTLRDVWKVTKVENIAEKIFKIHLKSEADFRLKLLLNGVGWMGKHFNISGKGLNNVTRVYTNVTALHPKIEEYRQKLLKIASIMLEGNSLDKVIGLDQEKEPRTISITSEKWNQVKNLLEESELIFGKIRLSHELDDPSKDTRAHNSEDNSLSDTICFVFKAYTQKRQKLFSERLSQLKPGTEVSIEGPIVRKLHFWTIFSILTFFDFLVNFCFLGKWV